MNTLREIVESKILPFVDKPMRYAGSELNTIQKKLDECTVHGVLCFPDLYEIGMSHFGIQMLYHIVNKHDTWALSRCFHPWTDMEAMLRKHNVPLYSLEYFSSLGQADWVGFSVQYELQYTNILNMLDLAGIPLFVSERGDTHPLIVTGGPCMSNPEPLSKFIDVVAVGDGEENIVRICELIEKRNATKSSKATLLKWLSEIPGLYVPSMYQRSKSTRYSFPLSSHKVIAAKVPHLRDEFYPAQMLVPLMEVVHHRLAVEVMRGCTRGCRFCAAGMWYRPVRERQPDAIVHCIESGIYSTGWRDISLLSLSTADYTCLWTLLESVRSVKTQHQVHVALPSTRLDALTDEQLEVLDKVSPLMSLTIAPEAGSERLRRVINKDFTDKIIFDIVKKLLNKNVQTLKLYFMVGLPTETDEDIEAIVKMITVIAGMVRATSHRREVHVAISPFSPKPHTPFQYEKMESISTLEARSRAIKNSCKYLKNVKVSYRNPHITFLETVMARGDDQIGMVIFNAWKKGARFDGWDEFFNIDRWFEAAREEKISLESYCDKIADDQTLPWSVLSSGVTDEFLRSERDKAFNEVSTADCRNGNCVSCGVCGDQAAFDLADSSIPPKVFPVASVLNEKSPDTLFRYRIWFSKGLELRFLGHLDMSALIQRAFLMAGVQIAYSNGFHPHPRISFGPPLPLGVFSSNEAFDIVTSAPMTDLGSVNKLLPKNLLLHRFESVDITRKSLFEMIHSAHYKFIPLFPVDISGFKINLQTLMEKSEVIIHQTKKGRSIEKNIRPGVLTVDIDSTGNSFLAELSFGPAKSCKPLELVQVLFPEKLFSDLLVERVSCNFK